MFLMPELTQTPHSAFQPHRQSGWVRKIQDP
jgi:hypothetical protein